MKEQRKFGIVKVVIYRMNKTAQISDFLEQNLKDLGDIPYVLNVNQE